MGTLNRVLPTRLTEVPPLLLDSFWIGLGTLNRALSRRLTEVSPSAFGLLLDQFGDPESGVTKAANRSFPLSFWTPFGSVWGP